MVSVGMLTFNHRNHIRQAVEGVLKQETAFRTELVIHDDASDDGTTAIVQELANEFPNLIRLIIQPVNLTGLGWSIYEIYTKQLLPQLKGKYIAFCEGDDAWTDPKKLSSQVEFLEQHENFTICFHTVAIHDDSATEQTKSPTTVFPQTSKTVFETGDIIAGNFIPNCSVMYRNVLKEFSNYFNKSILPDWPLHLQYLMKGKAGMLHQTMAIHKVRKNSFWNSRPDIEKKHAEVQFLLSLLWFLDSSYHTQILHAVHDFNSTYQTVTPEEIFNLGKNIGRSGQKMHAFTTQTTTSDIEIDETKNEEAPHEIRAFSSFESDQGETIRLVLPEESALWDAFVDNSPQGMPFCKSWWLSALTGWDYRIVAIFSGNTIVAGMPLAFDQNRRVNEPPLTRSLGPLFGRSDQLSRRHSFNSQRRWTKLLAQALKQYDFFQFCTHQSFNDWLPFRWEGFQQTTRYTYVIDYKDQTEESLWKNLSTEKKRNIIKAQKLGFEVEISNDIDAFYHLEELTYAHQGLGFNISTDFMRGLDDELTRHGSRAIFLVSSPEGKTVAGSYVVFNKREAFDLMSGSDPAYRHTGCHSLANWEAVSYFMNKTEIFNFGGSDIERIERHLNGYGGQLTPYFHLMKQEPPQKKQTETRTITETLTREIPFNVTSDRDDWRFHLDQTAQHSLILAKKVLYKLHIRFSEAIRISIVSPCFNHGQFVNEMIDSVLCQTYPHLELIIVNDGSTDNTRTILDRVRNKRIRVFHTENRGPAHARNFGIAQAKGDLIINLDADDKIAPTFVQRCVSMMDKYPTAGIVYSDVQLFGHKNEPFDLPDYNKEGMLKANCIVANACFRKQDWLQTGGYSDVMKNGYEDYDFWLSILELGRDVFQIKEKLVFYRSYADAMQSRSGQLLKDERLVQQVRLKAYERHMNLFLPYPGLIRYFDEMRKEYLTSQAIETPDAVRVEQSFKNENNPVFSIVTPTNNRPQLLKRAIESVLKQNFSDFEQIIVDDANQNESRQIVESFADDRLKYIAHQHNKGASASYNTGMMAASGTFINFLDDDDEYLPGILEKTLETFLQPESPDFVWTGITRVKDTAEGELPLRSQSWPARFTNLEEGLKVSTAIGNGFGLSLKKSCLEKTGIYDETLQVGEDTDFMMRLSQHFRFMTIPEVLVKIHHHEYNQLTHKRYVKVRIAAYGQILKKNHVFLKAHPEVYMMHLTEMVRICVQNKNRTTALKQVLGYLRHFPRHSGARGLLVKILLHKDAQI